MVRRFLVLILVSELAVVGGELARRDAARRRAVGGDGDAVAAAVHGAARRPRPGPARSGCLRAAVSLVRGFFH